MAKAGFEDGVDVTFRVAEYGQYGDAVVARMQQEWRDIGIRLNLEKMEWVTYMHAWAEGLPPEHGGLQLGWGMSADYWVQLIAHSKFQSPNGTNSGYYSNPEVDELFDQAAAESDDAKRRDLLPAGAADHRPRRRGLHPDHLRPGAASALIARAGLRQPAGRLVPALDRLFRRMTVC